MDSGANSSFPLTLYDCPTARGAKVQWLAAELGVPLDVQMVHLRKKHQNSDQYKKLNPMSQVPLLVQGNLMLTESNAILLFLLEHFDSSRKFQPQPATDESTLFHQVFHFSHSSEQNLVTAVHCYDFVPRYEKSVALELASQCRKTFEEKHVYWLKKFVADKKFICGDKFTAADIVCWYTLRLAQALSWLENHPDLANYLGRITSREKYKGIWPEVDPFECTEEEYQKVYGPLQTS